MSATDRKTSPAPAHAMQDADARKAGRTIFGKSLVLEAGAGTGKTAVLVARIVHWCLGDGWARYDDGSRNAEEIAEAVCEGVVAITFTDAAAVEMQVRVAQALRGIYDGQTPVWMPRDEFALDDEELRRRAEALLSSADRLRVQTIHSFCSTILRQNALRMGLHPRFEIDADGSQSEALVLDFIGKRLPELYGSNPDPDAVLLAAEGHGASEVASVLLSLARNAVTADDILQDPFSEAELGRLCDRLRQILQPVLKIHFDALSLVKDNKVKVLLRTAENATLLEPRLEKVESGDDLVKLFADGMPGTCMLENKLDKWAVKDFTESEKSYLSQKQIDQLSESFAEFKIWGKWLARLKPAQLAAGMRLLKRLLAELKEKMRTLGVQTFSDLLADTGQLLRNEPELCLRLAAGIDQLMVDEFQDTDALQCQLLHNLVMEPKAIGASAPDLFLVGDPKQSIYGWRNADLRSYHDFVQTVLQAGGEQFDLTVNFRSVPPILDEVERCVEPVMQEVEGVQPKFQRLHPAPNYHNYDASTENASEAAVEHWVSWQHEGQAGDETKSGAARELEAAALAHDLRRRHKDGSLKWSDAAILLRSGSAMETYLGALRDADIPFQVERDTNFYRRREIIDAAAMVRCVVDPNDQLALITFLRSPSVGVPDAAWLPLWQAGFPAMMADLRGSYQRDLLQSIHALIQQTASKVNAMPIPGIDRIEGWQQLMQNAVDGLAELRLQFHVAPADEFIHNLRRRFPIESTEAARHLGAHRLANLERFFLRLTEALQDAEGGPQSVLRSLRRAVSEGLEESEAAPGDQSMDAVRVMTVHKSKGLTFPHVYLVNLHAGKPNERELKVDIGLFEGRQEFQLFGMSTPNWAGVVEHRRKLEASERVRLMYVAMTRPQYRLVMAGKRPAQDDVKPLARCINMEELLRWRPGRPELLESYQDNVGREFEMRDKFGARWLFPNPPSEIDYDRHAEGRAAIGRTLPQVLAGFEKLQADRSHARRLQSRALTSTASGAVSHEALREVLHGGEGVDLGVGEWPPAPDGFERHAREVGTTVHRVLEQIDLQLSAEIALERELQNLERTAQGLVPQSDLTEVVAQARHVLEQMDNNGLLHELFERKQHILGREVPVLLPDSVGSSTIVGTLDLLYRDPASGNLVVADFKSDQVRDVKDAEQLAQAYQAQGQIYCQAVERMFPNEEPPLFELWFLRAGEICAANHA